MIKLNRWYTAFSLAAVLILFASVGRTQVSAGRYDREIQQMATNVLASKGKWKGITASTEDGIVTLDGSVKLHIDKVDAGRKVSKISHADGVRNHVKVEGDVPDSELPNIIRERRKSNHEGAHHSHYLCRSVQTSPPLGIGT